MSFFVGTSSDILAAAKLLRDRTGFSASDAAKLALALNLLCSGLRRHSTLVVVAPLLEAAGELLSSLHPLAGDNASVASGPPQRDYPALP